jgi:hypothetical protein
MKLAKCCTILLNFEDNLVEFREFSTSSEESPLNRVKSVSLESKLVCPVSICPQQERAQLPRAASGYFIPFMVPAVICGWVKYSFVSNSVSLSYYLLDDVMALGMNNLRELSQPQERFAPKCKRNQEKILICFEVIFLFISFF